MNRLFLWSLTSALAGFLFGFDTVVISGAEQRIQALWNLSSGLHGLAMAAALFGTVLGSLIGGWPTDVFGRKKTLLSIGILYFVSAVWSALAPEVTSFIIARFIGGVGVGISTVAAPLYISEIAPPARRGRLAGMFQFNIVFGILVAFLSNYLIGKAVDVNAWRWMLGVEALPALVYALLCLGIPESPRWLIARKGNREEGERVLGRVHPEQSSEQIRAAVEAIAQSGDEPAATKGFWSSRLKVPILLALLIAFFNQLSGINVILYFAPRLLGLAGIQDPLLASISIGVTNLVFTFVGLYLIDRLGRRTLLYLGSLGYILSLGVCAWAFLSFVEFKVVSKAIDVLSACESVAQLDSGASSLLPEDAQKVRAGYENAIDALVDVTSLARYQGAPVTAPVGIAPHEMKEIAEASKQEASQMLGNKSLLVLICIMAFIAAHAVGQGAVIWVFIAEIFPNRYRAPGQSLGSGTHWVFAALLTLLFPIAIARFDAGFLFLFFCGMMVLQLVWVKCMVPETKGVPLEEIEKELGVRS